MRRTITAMIAAAIAATGTLAIAPAADAAKGPRLAARYAPCAQEDSAGPCVWVANEQGNGAGHSFVVTRKQRVKYISNKRANRIVRYDLCAYEQENGPCVWDHLHTPSDPANPHMVGRGESFRLHYGGYVETITHSKAHALTD